MRRKLISCLAGGSLVASLVAISPTTQAGAQGTWAGFDAIAQPSTLPLTPPATPSAWAAAFTEDLGGAGTDILTNNHALLGENRIDYLGTGLPATVVTNPGPIDTHGIAFTDLDADGDEDLLEIMAVDDDNRILRNDAGTLVTIAGSRGLEDNDGRGRQPLVLDLDFDGDMDVLINNLERSGAAPGDPDNDDGPDPSKFFLNDGNGTFTFTEVADPSDILDDADLNWATLTSQGPGTAPVVLTHNNFAVASATIATGSPTLAAAGTPFAPIELASPLGATRIRDIVFGDWNGDLFPEFAVARQDNNLETDDSPADGTPDFLGALPIAKGVLSTVSPSALTSLSSDALADNCASLGAGDFDNDGDLDLFGGCTFDDASQSRNIILLNDGAGNFSLGGASLVPATAAETTVTTVVGDADQDGWLDVYGGAGFDSEVGTDFLFQNKGGNGNHFVQIDLESTDNPDAMGAQVFFGTNKWQVRETGHIFHQGQDSRTVHFGLGSETDFAQVLIRWPEGAIESCEIAGIDQRVTITQGSASCSTITGAQLSAALAAVPDVGTEEEPPPPPPAGPFCGGVQVTVDLNFGQSPTEGDDVILGTTNADVINSLGGNDLICGKRGDDIINGGDGNDRIFGNAGKDTINGGRGNDIMHGGNRPDTIFGGPGNDRLVGNNRADTLRGGPGNDILLGRVGRDRLFGGVGFDIGIGGIGRDSCDVESATSCEVTL